MMLYLVDTIFHQSNSNTTKLTIILNEKHLHHPPHQNKICYSKLKEYFYPILIPVSFNPNPNIHSMSILIFIFTPSFIPILFWQTNPAENSGVAQLSPRAAIIHFYIYSKWKSIFILISPSKSSLCNLHNAAIM